ncbi:MAG: M23 family metallopeptidase [Bacteroidota bacterium]
MWGGLLFISGLVLMLASSGHKLVSPLMRKLVIRSDAMGNGAWHAPRGNRLHKGIDFEVGKGAAVFAPISGEMHYVYPYRDDHSYGGVQIQGDELEVRIYYMKPFINPGQSRKVGAGEQIGTAQSISQKYGASMQDHLHVEILQKGQWIDPTNYFL